MPFHATRNPQPATPDTFVASLLKWFASHARDLPWRRTRDPYAVWVSEIMLQQTQVKTVIPYWSRWMKMLPTIQSAAKASPAKLHKLWEGLGYYTRVRNLQKAARQILAEHEGKFPATFDAVLALPGIGRYTAGAICSIAFDQPTPILDGNVLRVLTRLYGTTTDPREKKANSQLWQFAGELVHHASRITHHASPCSHLNQSLMELGALICTPRSPDCAVCPLNKLCIARQQNLQEQVPKLAKRSASTARHFIAFVVERHGKFLVRQRSGDVVNAKLWEFPNVEVGVRPGERKQALAELTALRITDPRSGKIEPLCTIKHSITRYRITLEAFRAELPNARSEPEGKWLSRPQLHKLAFTSAHRKILARLETPGTASAKRIVRY